MTVEIPEKFKHGLGRIQNHDPKNWDYPVLLNFMSTGGPIRSRNWRYWGKKLWQRNIGACTGFQAAHALNCGRYNLPGQQMGHVEAFTFYSVATGLDQWAGQWFIDGWNEDGSPRWYGQDTGSDGGSVGRVLVDRGLISSYRWGNGVDGAIQALQDGPVGFGSVWTEDMFYPNQNGYVQPTGRRVGGHQYLVKGWDMKYRRFICLNSWNDPNDPWGLNGTGIFYIAESDAFTLLERWEGDVVQYEQVAA